ncbi:MAG: hypothetical protein JZU65_07185, partial [Chlorobium sp.]|nr:hypothetical protein [Chlorobium sp.]
GLVQKLPAPTVHDGEMLDTHQMKNLTVEEEVRYQEVIKALKKQAKPQQEKVVSEYIEREADKLSAGGEITLEDARKIVESRQDHILEDRDFLFFVHQDKGVAVSSVLADGEKYHNKSLADPAEPEYEGGSKTKAKFFWNDGNPIIHSYAHGSGKYRFRRFVKNSESAKDEPEQPKTPMDIFMKYALSDEYVNGIGKEEFLYPDLIIKNHILVLIAESGGGKTTFNFFTVAPFIAEQGYQVLYFDADSPPSDHPRMKHFSDDSGFKHLNPDVNLGTSVESLIFDLDALAGKQMSLNRYVLFFDTMKKFIDLMGKREAKAFFILMRKLTKLGATVILLGHANKHRDADGRLIPEGVGDVKNDCDDMLFFERDRMPDGSLNVTMICDTDKGAKVRGVFKPFSFSISPEREVTFYEKALEAVDLSNTGTPKATDSEILDCAEQYLRDRGEPVVQSDLVEYTADRVEGQAGVERVRKLIVKRSVLKSNFTTKKEMPFGARFLFEGGDRNKRLYQLPAEPPMQRPVFGEGP